MVGDDDRASRDLMQYLLGRWGFNPQMARDGVEAWEILQEHDKPTLAILDWVMPGLTGIEISQKIRAVNSLNYTYILMLTAKSDQSDLITSLRAGADDYLKKPLDAEELQARLLVAERTLRVQSELIVARDLLAQEAKTDFLTGLLNRGGIMRELEREMSRSHRLHDLFSIIMVDVDHFKGINDSYGHDVGDQVLRETATRMREIIRAHDSLGRYGGEEFLAVLTGCNEGSALVAAEKLREQICNEPFSVSGSQLRVTASFGVATAVGETSPQVLLRAADLALYRAKNDGRNCVRVGCCKGSEDNFLDLH